MGISLKVFETREQWLANRKLGIGGSDISAVIGKNPYMSNVELWEIKTGLREAEDISHKEYVKFGNEAEPLLRALFCLDYPEYTVEHHEYSSYTNSKYPWAKVSLDGKLIDPNGKVGVLEIKTTEILRSQQKEKWSGQIPDNYYCQCLFYMAVIEAEYCILKVRLKSVFEGVPHIQVKHYHFTAADHKDDMEYLMQSGSVFWEQVKKKKKPDLILPEI